MFVIGRGRQARETYPEAGARGALIALTNRYLIDPSGASIPSAFTVTTPTTHIVAAVNVVRRASGIFMIAVQMPTALSGADTQVWSAVARFGVTATGGAASGNWLLDTGSAISTAVPADASVLGVFEVTSGAGNLVQTVTLTGVNSKPVPQGTSAIIIQGTTVSGTQITPGSFFGVVYELP